MISRTFTFSTDKADVNNPLSGPKKYCPAASTSNGRRDDPTPGSTTATCTVPFGNHRHASPNVNAASAKSNGRKSCVRSTTVASGQIV